MNNNSSINPMELWQRIEQFPLDDPQAAFPFSARLARENGWAPAYTRRVIAEYRRFVLLAMTAGHPVSPSEQVDEVWHLHILYTRSYWEQFCGQVLPRPLHHEPSKGGSAETTKFSDWYNRTLASYERQFSQPPPADIWPPPHARLARAGQGWTASNFVQWIRGNFKVWPGRLLGLLITLLLALGLMQGSAAAAPLTAEEYTLSHYEANFELVPNAGGTPSARTTEVTGLSVRGGNFWGLFACLGLIALFGVFQIFGGSSGSGEGGDGCGGGDCGGGCGCGGCGD